MKKLYYDLFAGNRRFELVKECGKTVKKGLKVFYILPSREAMFHVRRLFTAELGGICGCHVFGFDDFERLILGKSLDEAKIIGNMEQLILLRTVLKELPSDSPFYNVKGKPGFSKHLAATIRRLKRLNITPEQFLKKISDFNGNLYSKCNSLCKIYSNYEKIKEGKGLCDVDDISLKAVKECPNSRIFENTGIIVIDGFINIDSVNAELLRRIYKEYPHISIFVNVPFRNIYNEDFLEDEILKVFSELSFEREMGEVRPEGGTNPFLISLSRHIYSGKAGLQGDQRCLKISGSPCIDHEIRTAAGRAKELIQDFGVKPSDIAVIAADLQSYKSGIVEVFGEYGVPVNVKRELKLSSIPVIKDALSLWRLGYDEEKEEAFCSIVSSKYLLPFDILKKRGFKTDRLVKIAKSVVKNGEVGNYFEAFLEEFKANTGDVFEREEMEGYIKEVISFENMLHENVAGSIDAFKKFLENVRIGDKIISLYKENLLEEELWLRDMMALGELSKLFERLGDAYEEYSLSGGEAGLHDLLEDISNASGNIETGDASRNLAGVRLLPPDLARGQTYDTVFILGLNEGIFPASREMGYLFNDHESGELFKNGINLRYSMWEMEREKLRFNMCIASARRRLYLSFRTADENDAVMLPSPFIDEVLSVLNNGSKEKILDKPVSMRDRVGFKGESYSVSESVKAVLSRLRNSREPKHSAINKEVIKRIGYPIHASAIEFSRASGKAFDAYDGKLKDPVLAQQDTDYGFSPSQLNSYVRCPFIYFAQRVLNLSAEDEELQERLDLGNFYHAVLKEYYDGNPDPMEPDYDRLRAAFDSARAKADLSLSPVPAALEEFTINEQFMVLKKFIEHDAGNMLRYKEETGHILKPVMLEENFKMPMGDGKGIIKGVADRIDLEARPDGSYTGRFIIYDYKKSSIKGIKECIEGKDFQLPLYYAAFSKILRKRFGIERPECLALLYYSIEKLEWNGIIRKDIKKALFEGRKGTRSTPEGANMEIVLSWAQREAETVMERIRTGNFMPPKECPTAGFIDCKYRGMCRYDRIRLSKKKEVNRNDKGTL